MASKFGSVPAKLHPTSTSRSRDQEAKKTPVAAKRASSIPIPTPTSTSRSTFASPSSSSTISDGQRKLPGDTTVPDSRGRPIPATQRVKAPERRFPLLPTTQQQFGNYSHLSADPYLEQRSLRQKTPSSDQRSAYGKSQASVASHEYHGGSEASKNSYYDHSGTVLGIISLSPPDSSIIASQSATSHSRMQSFIDHGPQPPQPLSAPEFKPPTPQFVRSTSASTGISESPSPFSNFSRGSTPTSISSGSPAMSQIPKFGNRTAPSPTSVHPPIPRRKVVEASTLDTRAFGKALPAVREASNPTSSASSVKSPEPPVETAATNTRKKVLRKAPPNPPQRISSKTAVPSPSIDTAIARKPLKSSHNASPSTPLSTPSRSVTDKSNIARLPPSRPSREGTPILEGFGQAPIIQSNLNQLNASGSRMPNTTETINVTRTRSTRYPSGRLQQPKQNITQDTISKAPTIASPHLVSREQTRSREPPDSARSVATSKQSSREPSPSVASSPSKTLSRFGLFSRKLRSPSEPGVLLSESARKGPTAGTGHEGYGRYGRRGRSSSTSTAASRARSTSIGHTSSAFVQQPSSRKSSFNSSDGRPELDDFLKERLEPRVISGGGQAPDNRNSNVDSFKTSSSQATTLTEDPTDVVRSLYRQDARFAGSTISMAESTASTTVSSQPSGVSSPLRHTLAHRRSLLRLQMSGDKSGLKLPTPINTQWTGKDTGPATYDSGLSSALQTDASGPLTDVSEGHEGNWLRPKKKTLVKAKTPRKWNIFHRGQKSNDSLSGPAPIPQSSNGQYALGISGLDDIDRPAPFYALSDDFESDHAEPMEDQLKEIEDRLEQDTDAEYSEVDLPQARELSMLLPSPPQFATQFESLPPARARLVTPLTVDMTSVALNRKPRLQQIGRIPRVASKRDRVHRPSPQSFSRPFAPPTDADDDYDSSVLSEFPVAGGRPKLDLKIKSTSGYLIDPPYNNSIRAPPTNGMLHNLDGEREFLHFSPRKWSEVSTANSSDTMNITAITALHSLPDTILSDDEVWGEFDDLLDHVASPLSMSPCTPGLTIPKEYFSISDVTRNRTVSKVQEPSSDSGTSFEDSGSADDQPQPLAPPKPAFLGLPQTLHALHSPLSLGDLYDNYGGRPGNSKPSARDSALSTISGSHYSDDSPGQESDYHAEIVDAQAKRVTRVMAEKTRCTSTDSLRFSALMTSRWLCFNRVLFSPINERIRSNRQDRILVVDGLGNDDWSTYCAMKYPEAVVHSLSSMSSRSKQEQQNPENWTPPSNHRRHTYTSAAPFPFAGNWFSVVVFRFPTVNTTIAYRHAIRECKRVLRPGGYLELSVLDMDMVSMGSATSRAVRNLKMHMHGSRPDVSLSPASDEILKLLGKKGFENVSRAVVGVPVVESYSLSPSRSRDIRSPQHEVSKLSLGQLLAQQSQDDDPILPSTRAMAKAAQWWWSKCYENTVVDGQASIWEDSNLIEECEEWQTSLKLFVCYAQKPINTPRRTSSV